MRNRGGDNDVRNRGGDLDARRGDDARKVDDVRIVRESGDVRKDQRERELKMPPLENLSIAVNNR